jgi:hypothetical protein
MIKNAYIPDPGDKKPEVSFFNASTLDDSYQYFVVLILGIEVWVIFCPLYSLTQKALSKTIIYLYDN